MCPYTRYNNLFLIVLACRYEKGTWGECNAQSQMTRNDKLKANSDPSCEQNRQITKKCKPKGIKPTKGKYRMIFFRLDFILFMPKANQGR